MSYPTKAEALAHIRSNIKAEIYDHIDETVPAEVMFTYAGNPEWGDFPGDGTISFKYSSDEELTNNLSKALHSAEQLLVQAMTGSTKVTKMFYKRLWNYAFTISGQEFDQTDKRSFLCLGQYEFFLDLSPARTGKLFGMVRLEKKIAPVFAFALATKKPELVALVKRRK